jgi:hypothetical protein
MYASKIKLIALTATASLGLAACTGPGYGGFGVGVSSGYGGYGYDPYYDGYGYPYGGYGSYGSYGSPYGGWYNNYYYPGSGYWVYSRDGHRHRWTAEQRRYWEQRRERRQIERAQRSPTGQWGATQDGVVAVPRGTRPEDVFVAQQGQRVQRTETRRVERTQPSETRSERSSAKRDNGLRRLPRDRD